jgi:phosphomannomutase
MRRVEKIKIGISGVRGIIGDTLSPEIALNFTRAFATLIGRGKVAVAKDSRVSGDFLKRAVFSGLIYSGLTPVDTFTLPTPTLQLFVREKKLAGGIIITASHNPEEWNGLKFVDSQGLFISPFTAQHLIDLYHQRNFIIPQANQFPSLERADDAFQIHKRKIFSSLDLKEIKKKKFSVLVDPGGGAGSLYDEDFLRELGCRVKIINHRITKKFPRNPEPVPENLQQASQLMQQGNFDLGFAQDSDADRLAILDRRGKPLGSDEALAIALYGYLYDKPPGKIVLNLSTSRIASLVARKFGFEVIYSPVGEINVVEKIMEQEALAGGEGNGGVIIPGIHSCRDSFAAMALTLKLLAHTGKKVSDLLSEFPPLKIIKTKLPLSMTEAHRVVALLSEEYPLANREDGLRIDEEECWFHIRASNTEPVLRIIAEGNPDIIENKLKLLKEKVSSLIKY